jgi:hypothetical protein
METQAEPFANFVGSVFIETGFAGIVSRDFRRGIAPSINWAASASRRVLQDLHRNMLQPYAGWYAEHGDPEVQ